MKYKLMATRSYDRGAKRLLRDARTIIETEVFVLASDPRQGGALRHELKGLWSYHLKFNNTHYRVIYSINEAAREIELRWVGSRENLYKEVRRLNLKVA
ncbi:type II toxin-antitoxin system RelE/ParE family toxin [Chloroflexota bacterium]